MRTLDGKPTSMPDPTPYGGHDYKCLSCGYEFEVADDDDDDTKCPECGSSETEME